MAAKKYRERAIITTRLNPQEMARTVARTGLITEAQPLTPQAQGTRKGFLTETLLSPRGKGIPIKKAKGERKRRESTIFMGSDKEMNLRKMLSRVPK